MSKKMSYILEKDKSIAVILFILNALEHSDIHKLCKIIYFADQKHLARYGRPITGDWYVAMKDGPVPTCWSLNANQILMNYQHLRLVV
jgi:uncharacterized phage-associated protein